ncbi:MAG TPA: AAA domain-containing protein [Gemmataceae bacterium]|nr:AAA domain-containing protein [Gemmataceae bacterium]
MNSAVRPFDCDDRFSAWNQVFDRLPLPEKDQLLQLARQQGYLSPNQLPRSAKADHSGSESSRITQILAGQLEELEPAQIQQVVCTDGDLGKTQKRAVALALHTPDICLIQGLPGTGKSRVIAEIIHQAASRGDRILFVSPWSSTLDNFLAIHLGDEILSPWRLLGPNEKLEDLPQTIRGLTSEERAKSLKEHVAPTVGRQIHDIEADLQILRSLENGWPRLYSLAQKHKEATREIEKTRALPATLGANLASEMEAAEQGCCLDERINNLLVDLGSRRLKTDALSQETKNLAALVEEKSKRVEELANQMTPLADLVESKDHGRFWRLGWWKAMISSQSLSHARSIQSQLNQEKQLLKQLTNDFNKSAAALEMQSELDESFRKALIKEELDFRIANAERKTAELEARLLAIKQEWQISSLDLAPDMSAITCDESAVKSAEASWKEKLLLQETQLAFLRQWHDFVKDEKKDLDAWVSQTTNLVLAPVKSLVKLPFSAAKFKENDFDLVIVDGADALIETEFDPIAKLARRFVLVGDAPIDSPQFSAVPNKQQVSSRIRQAEVRPKLFHRLWNQLHCNPSKLPYRWHKDQERYCCRLQEIKPEQRHWLETELVADHPEIELRILGLPRKAPVLAEVVFPRSASLSQAKEYILAELQELAIQTGGNNLSWTEDENQLTLSFGDECHHQLSPIPIANGVIEHMQRSDESRSKSIDGSANIWTCCLEFQKAAGWHRPNAEKWIEKHLGLRSWNRTISLDRGYRTEPGLGQFLSDVLFQGKYRIPQSMNGPNSDRSNGAGALEFGSGPIEFILTDSQLDPPILQESAAVESSSQNKVQVITPPTLTRPSRTGLDQEIDLADSLQRFKLPQEISSYLPKTGLVNYREAQRVVHILESLVSSPFGKLTKGRHHPHGLMPTIGVIALYPAQVELIRRLIDQAPSLVASSVPLLVDGPAGFRGKECAIALLSLTRCHSHRTTSYGTGPECLRLALTRARQKLFIFGDPATLIRRSQWHGIVETLDEESSAVERELISWLVRYLQSEDGTPRTFQGHPGGWT